MFKMGEDNDEMWHRSQTQNHQKPCVNTALHFMLSYQPGKLR